MKSHLFLLSLLLVSCTLLTRGRCGDGVLNLNLNEACDDGDRQSGDGCANDCKTTELGFVCPTPGEVCEFVCLVTNDCNDDDPCTTDTCDLQAIRCVNTLEANGFVCDADSEENTRDICLEGVCAPSICDDQFVDEALGEECDDANDIEEDGCTTLCKSGTPCNNNEFNVGSGATTDPSTGNCYVQVNPPGLNIDWFAAEADCNAHNNGHLASIESQAIQDLVAAIVSRGGQIVWIGLNDQVVENSFVWSDGTPFLFANFAVGEPNNFANQDCVAMEIDGTWDDEDCGNLHRYICEFE
jgi:cysteine-rich repeat protein